ncbi:BNR repeat-containing protein [Nonomuraea sp. NPDC046570]|uniref:BNR repeat-containing protein n=1 Tax=Nonomuraea sp. NPDC046570 TaxID=3155255 RepID=UPI0033BFCE30
MALLRHLRRSLVLITSASALLMGLPGQGVAGADRPVPVAASPARLTPAHSTLIATDTHDWNNYAPDQSKVLTVGDYQYAIFYSDDLRLTLSRRRLGTDDVQLVRFPHRLSAPQDTHHNAVLGVSEADGRLHLSYDHHGHPLRYMRSVQGLLTSPPATIGPAHFESPGPLVGAGPLEERVTYPRFVQHPGGDLYLVYRVGSSGDGDTYLHRYDDVAGAWSRTGQLLSSNGTYPPWNNSTSRNAYLFDVSFDDTGRLHLTWTWREVASTFASNHDVHYAYSDDNGLTWRNNTGAQIANLPAGDPLELSDPAVVVEVPINSNLMNQGVMTLDSARQPHLITYVSTVVPVTPSTSNLHYVHFWRTADGAWHRQFIDDTSVKLPPINTLTHAEPFRRGDALVDDSGDLHFYSIVSGALYGYVAGAASGWSDWTVYRVGDAPVGLLDQGPKFDRTRWKEQGIVSMVVSRPQPDGTTDLYAEEFHLRPASTPAVPRLKVRPASRGVELLIDGAEGAESFVVERKSGDGPFVTLATGYSQGTMRRRYLDDGATAGVKHLYRVHAVNAAGHGPAAVAGGTLGDGWTDYTVDLDLRITTWSAGVAFRVNEVAADFDQGSFYWWAIQPARNGGELHRLIFERGAIRRLPVLPLPDFVAVNRHHHLTIRAIGDRITTLIDGIEVDSVTDGTHARGSVGFRHGRVDGDRTLYDNVLITEPGGAVLFEERFAEPTQFACGQLNLGALLVGPGGRCSLPVRSFTPAS